MTGHCSILRICERVEQFHETFLFCSISSSMMTQQSLATRMMWWGDPFLHIISRTGHNRPTFHNDKWRAYSFRASFGGLVMCTCIESHKPQLQQKFTCLVPHCLNKDNSHSRSHSSSSSSSSSAILWHIETGAYTP
jgi:hypothetical protein